MHICLEGGNWQLRSVKAYIFGIFYSIYDSAIFYEKDYYKSNTIYQGWTSISHSVAEETLILTI